MDELNRLSDGIEVLAKEISDESVHIQPGRSDDV